MRRRKATRGRPRKVKRGRLGKLRNSVPFDSKLSGDNLDDQTTSLKSDDAVSGFIGLDKIGPYSYRVGSVNIELEGADEDIKPVIQENDIMLEVECGSNTASMFLSRLCQGSKGSCIEFDGAWLTPNEFQFVSGRETAKDWKRSIRHFGRSLKLLITKGILTVHPAACRCDSCRLLSSTTNEPKLVLEKRDRELREKTKGGSEGSASGSDKEEGDRGSDDDEAEDGSEDAEDDSHDSAENGDDGSGSEQGEEDMEEEGKVEENNNEAGDKESSSSSSDGSSSSGSSSSDSDSDSDEDEKKEEEEEENEESAETEAKVDCPVQSETVFEEVSALAAEAAAAAVFTPAVSVASEEQMEMDEEEEEEEKEVEDKNVVDEPANDIETSPQEEEEDKEEAEMETSEKDMTTSESFDDKSINGMEQGQGEESIRDECQPEIQPSPEEPTKPSISPEPSEATETEQFGQFENFESVDEQLVKSEQMMESGNTIDGSAPSDSECVQEDVLRDPVLPKDEESRDSSSNAPSVDSIATNSSRRELSPVPSKVSTPTMSENPPKKTVERSNSGGGKSRLSNIIDLLRTSKEKETQKQVVPDRPEEKRQEKSPPEVKDVKTPSPLPPKREEVRSRKPEREEMKPIRDEIKINEKAREAMRYPPMGRLPFGFPPPDLLERASREAHEQLSKSHRQFEKNLESLIAQNMNPFIPELSIFSLPEHRAQMEYNYLKNMERLDQMAKERMATMAEMRHQQLIREHNSFVAKLAEHQQKTMRQEPERPRDPVKKPVAVPKRREDGALPQSKVPPAHRAMPEVRKEKPDQRTLQTPPAAHHHLPTARPPSTGSKPPSSLPLPASTARAAHPTGPSATQSRSSPMIAPIAPPLQMWSSCFPYVIPPPTIEMQRLTQFFPNLNGGLFSTDTGAKRHTESPILDLSTKKRKMHLDARDHESRSKEPRLSSNSKSVHSSPHANGLPREHLHHRSHSNKDSSAKERPMWANFERGSALSCTCALQHLNDMRTWSVDDVCCFLKGLEGCTLYVDAFRRNGIDGNTLILLTPDTLIKSLGMKPGSARFLTDSVAKRARELQKLVPCEYCRMKIQKG